MNWKRISRIVGSAVLTTSLITGIFFLDDRYAKGEDIVRVEKQTVQTLDRLEKRIDGKILNDRYLSLSDQQFQIKMMLMKMPDDGFLKDELERITIDKIKIKEKLDKLNE